MGESNHAAFAVQRAAVVASDRVLLSQTHVWLHAVPRSIHPVQLCRHYPRIANQIAECWHDQTLVDRLLIELIIDRRGGRIGFPFRIADELRALATFNAKLERAGRRKGAAAIARLFRRIASTKRDA
jgi:hypothetical protein